MTRRKKDGGPIDPTWPVEGWRWLGVVDLGVAKATCENCRYEGIRYLHTVFHPREDMGKKRVGCVCVGVLTRDDLELAEREQKALENAARRKSYREKKEAEWRAKRYTPAVLRGFELLKSLAAIPNNPGWKPRSTL